LKLNSPTNPVNSNTVNLQKQNTTL
jgi:hypothetical protein